MRLKFMVGWLAFCVFLLPSHPSYAVDDSAADLVALGQLNLMDITDMINKKYPKEKENYWDIASIAYHDFTGVPDVDVIVGLEGYHDNGKVFNNGNQLVEDAGAGFAYFHKDKENWKLKQVELVEGMEYDGFQGADLIGLGKDQLVVYSAQGQQKYATVFMMPMNHVFQKITVIVGKDYGPRVSQTDGQYQLADFRRALINPGYHIYFGQGYQWKDHQFVPDPVDFLDAVEKYSSPSLDQAARTQGLAWFENYLTSHPDDFCALANCYDLSRVLHLTQKAQDYKKKLLQLGMNSQLNLDYCDQWLSNQNRNIQQQYLNDLETKSKSKSHGFSLF